MKPKHCCSFFYSTVEILTEGYQKAQNEYRISNILHILKKDVTQVVSILRLNDLPPQDEDVLRHHPTT